MTRYSLDNGPGQPSDPTMDPLDKYDVQESFEAMDEDKLGTLTMDNFYTLYLGLGYPHAEREDLQSQVEALQGSMNEITLATVFTILSKLPRDRQSEMSRYFELLDNGSKGYLDSGDIQQLAATCGETISEADAEAMLRYTTEEHHTRLYASNIRQLLAPPSP